MLDQNTDRMWYVIGAVLIGAAILFGVNVFMPEAFASVGSNIIETLGVADERVDEITANSVASHYFDSFYSDIIDYDDDTLTFTVRIDPEAAHERVDSGIQIQQDAVIVPYGYKHTILYDIYTPIDILTRQDVNTPPVEGPAWLSRIDNDEWVNRRFNGQQARPNIDYDADKLAPTMSLPLEGGKWTTISYSYTNTAPENEDQIAIADTSSFGVYAHDIDSGPFDIQIRNVRNIITKVGE